MNKEIDCYTYVNPIYHLYVHVMLIRMPNQRERDNYNTFQESLLGIINNGEIENN